MNENDAHRHFSVRCSNDVWGLLETADRSGDDNRLMIEMAHASLFHWLRREDRGPRNVSIGLWLLSRVHSTLGRGAMAMDHAQECIEASSDLDPFCRGHAFEAASRAAPIQEDRAGFDSYLRKACEALEQDSDAEERNLLAADLADLKERSGAERG